MRYLLFVLILSLSMDSFGQLQKAKGYQFVSAEAGFIPQENFGYHGSLSYGRYLEKNLGLKLHLSYEDFGFQWLDTAYYVYERKVDPSGVEYLDTVRSPRERGGSYRALFASMGLEVALLGRFETFYVSLELAARAGVERESKGADLKLAYGAGGGPLIELYLDPQVALLGRARYEYMLASRFESRLSLIVGLRYSFR